MNDAEHLARGFNTDLVKEDLHRLEGHPDMVAVWFEVISKVLMSAPRAGTKKGATTEATSYCLSSRSALAVKVKYGPNPKNTNTLIPCRLVHGLSIMWNVCHAHLFFDMLAESLHLVTKPSRSGPQPPAEASVVCLRRRRALLIIILRWRWRGLLVLCMLVCLAFTRMTSVLLA